MQCKRVICGVLTFLFCLLAHVAAPAVTVTPQEMAEASRWLAAKFVGEKPDLPISFVYDGKPSGELLPNWKLHRESKKLDPQRTEHTLTYTDPKSGLVLRCVAIEYRDFPTVEWTLYFKNTGAADTPILENIQALDAAWQRGPLGEFLLHHDVGSPANKSDYGPLRDAAWPQGHQADRRRPAAARPTATCRTSTSQWGGEGVILVVGWPGQWAAEFARDAADGLQHPRRPGTDPLQAPARRRGPHAR